MIFPVCHAVICSSCWRKTGRMKTEPYNANPSSNPMLTPADNCRLFRMRKLITGSSVVSSCQMRAIPAKSAVKPSIVTKRDSHQS
jgi:hypothetical protein